MNIRFIILKAGNPREAKDMVSESFELAWGSMVSGPDKMFRGTEFSSYKDAFNALQRVQEQHKECSYRLACVWDEV